jgi:hypothetical protein
MEVVSECDSPNFIPPHALPTKDYILSIENEKSEMQNHSRHSWADESVSIVGSPINVVMKKPKEGAKAKSTTTQRKQSI